jgi:class 3 adenylate cyclase
VDRVILYATYACGGPRDDYPFGSDEAWESFIDDVLMSFNTDWMDDLVRGIAPSVARDPDVLHRIVNMYRLGTNAEDSAEVSRLLRDLDIRPVLPSIQAPTLVLHPMNVGEYFIGPPEESQYLADQIPDARVLEIEGGDHEMYSGDVDAVLDAVEEFVTGARRVPDTNRVLATVLFTDIVDSTRKATEVGDTRWKDLLAEHDERAKAEIERFRGRYIESTGDGLIATFDGPARAVHCAQAIGQESVRGLAVHIGARVCALAGAGEVLVSSTVKDLSAGSGLTFDDAGERELKGVPRLWRLYRVTSASA